VEQLWRDNRLNPIHEGTTGIQALDLVGRKIRRDTAGAFDRLDMLVRETAARAVGTGLADQGRALGAAWGRIVAAVRPENVLVLDEAYFEFTDDGLPDGLAALCASPLSFVVLRTFSKAYGLAGLRVGYAVTSDARLARAMTAAKTPFNVNAAAQAAAVAALEDEAWMRASVSALKAERERVAAAIAAMDLPAARSQTNFLFLDVRRDSQAAAEAFAAADPFVVEGVFASCTVWRWDWFMKRPEGFVSE